MDREVVEAGEEREEQHGLQHQVDGAKPAGGAITLDRQHGASQWWSSFASTPRMVRMSVSAVPVK